MNTRIDLLSGFMVSLFAWNPLRRRPWQGHWRHRNGPGLRLGRGWLFTVILFLTLVTPVWAEPKVSATLDRNTISIGETVTLTLNFLDCSPDAQPNIPALPNVDVVGQQSQQSYVLDGGSMTRKVIFSYELKPNREGIYTIPSMRFAVNGSPIQTRQLAFKVLHGAVPSTDGENAVAFVKISIPTNTIYLGEILPVELQCYCRNNVANIQMPQLSSDNFIIGEIPNTRQQAPRVNTRNGVFNMFTFRTTATAIKTGNFTLGPATWSLTVLGGQQTFFGWTESHQGNFNSDTPAITVLPIPTNGAPPGFAGAIGDFTLTQYEAGPTSVGVGDPITLKIRIAGTGSFDTLSLATNQDPSWREFKTYPPSSKVEITDPSQSEGSKYFEQVISPQNAEVREIPPFVFSFFDPTRGEFRTLTHGAVPLTVHATAATPQPTVLSAGGPPPETQEQTEDIVHIKPMLGSVHAAGPPLLEQPAFLAWQAVPPLAWIGALALRKRKENLANNPRLRRQRQVAGIVRHGLSGLAHAAAAKDADKFYSTVLRLLQEQLGERLDLPAPAITEAVLDDLSQKSARPETLALLKELFHACNQYRYTPEHTSQEMNLLIPKVKTALHDLQSMPALPARGKLPQSVGLLLLLLGIMTAHAESANDAFVQANKLYEEGKYPAAAAAYEKLAQSGIVSPDLYFNLGNACLKAGQIGRAICAYRSAEAIAPRDPDIRANLQSARVQAATYAPALPGSRWTRWVGRLSLNEWSVMESIFLALFFILLTAREISPAFRRAGSMAVAGAGMACLCAGACLGLAVDQRLIVKSSVVVVPEAVARLGPLPEAQSAFTVHDGAELLVLGRDGDWLQVSDAVNHTGWLAQKDVALIP